MTAQAIAPVRTRAEWAEIINADWRRSIEGIIQTGRDLEAAAKELPGEFAAMVRDDLPFSIETADKLRRIARHPTISNPSSRTSFPPSWTVLHELSKLSERDFADAQSSGLISDATSRRKAAAIADAYRTPEGVAVGEGRSPNFLPSPKEAREVARATNRLVAASDGNLYSGATEEEGEDYERRRNQTYKVIDAIHAIAKLGMTPEEWLEGAEKHWFNRFSVSDIETAISWLDKLHPAFCDSQWIIDQ